MILVRAPLRVSLGGGGTDLPSYYSKHGGFVVSAAIDKYVYVAVNQIPSDEYLLKYAESERVADPSVIRHPILREVLSGQPAGVEVAVLADVPARTGLGSSGAFTVACLKAFRPNLPARWLAEEASWVEIDRLGRPVGEQDQYVAAYGGVRCYTFFASGAVTVDPLAVPGLDDRLLLFDTGETRDAAQVLGPQHEAVENLHETRKIGRKVYDALLERDYGTFADLMDAHWRVKRERSPGITTPEIDRAYELGRANGARGGKLVGAGGGGFLMFYADDPALLRSTMERVGLRELAFGFAPGGAEVLCRS